MTIRLAALPVGADAALAAVAIAAALVAGIAARPNAFVIDADEAFAAFPLRRKTKTAVLVVGAGAFAGAPLVAHARAARLAGCTRRPTIAAQAFRVAVRERVAKA